MTVSCEWMVADPLDSMDCPTFARGSACAVRWRLRRRALLLRRRRLDDEVFGWFWFGTGFWF